MFVQQINFRKDGSLEIKKQDKKETLMCPYKKESCKKSCALFKGEYIKIVEPYIPRLPNEPITEHSRRCSKALEESQKIKQVIICDNIFECYV